MDATILNVVTQNELFSHFHSSTYARHAGQAAVRFRGMWSLTCAAYGSKSLRSIIFTTSKKVGSAPDKATHPIQLVFGDEAIFTSNVESRDAFSPSRKKTGKHTSRLDLVKLVRMFARHCEET